MRSIGFMSGRRSLRGGVEKIRTAAQKFEIEKVAPGTELGLAVDFLRGEKTALRLEKKLHADEPSAVLAVRESDRLPGQGWWNGVAEAHGYKGEWTGPDAAALVKRLQAEAFDYWAAKARRR